MIHCSIILIIILIYEFEPSTPNKITNLISRLGKQQRVTSDDDTCKWSSQYSKALRGSAPCDVTNKQS